MSSSNRQPLVVVGDTNIDALNSPNFSLLSNLFLNYDCHNCHTLVTRPVSKTSIDQVFSSVFNIISVDSVECSLTDHNIICCNIQAEFVPKNRIIKSKVVCDYEKLRELLNMSLISNENTDDISVLIGNLISCIGNAIKESTKTYKYEKLVKFEIAPWINRNLQILILYKHRILAKRRKTKSNKYDWLLKRLGKVIKLTNNTSRENYYQDCLGKFNNDPPKKIWNFMNTTTIFCLICSKFKVANSNASR